MKDFRGRALRCALVVAALVALAACTTVTITPHETQAPTQTFHTVVVGKVDNPNAANGYLDTFFREGLIRRLGELKAFDNVTDSPSDSASADTLFVTGWVTEADKGNEALRLFVGMGAGREHVTAQLELKNSQGQTIGHLEIRKAYSGGAGIGGAGFIDVEDLTKQVGEQAAQTLLDWSQGKPIAN